MKMAIVGCEASGKTVFMCALADYYGQDAANNPNRLRLTPENSAANSFERFQFRQMRCLRQWPPATPPDRSVEMKWSLRRDGEPVASVDMLEFGGETYRAAFREGVPAEQKAASASELLKYLSDADFFVVLVSIKALLADFGSVSESDFERETEALWVTRGIIEFIRANRPQAGVVIGLTQADKYQDEIQDAGGAEKLFARRWPSVAAAATRIPVVEVASVSKTDNAGNPAEGYRTSGIQPVMRIFSKYCFSDENALENGSGAALASIGKKTGAQRKTSAILTTFVLPVIALVAIAVGLFAILDSNKRTPSAPADPIVVTNTVTEVIATAVTNTVEKIVEKPVTNTIKKIVEKAVTNTVEKIVEKPVVSTIEKIVERPVTNTIEKIIEKVVTNTIEKIVEKPVADPVDAIAADLSQPRPVLGASLAPRATNTFNTSGHLPVAERQAPLKIETAPAATTNDFRTWTDHKGGTISARWISTSSDKDSIKLVTHAEKHINAVLRKFSQEDQEYIRNEIKRHEERGEILDNGIWVRNPMLNTDRQ